MSDKTKKILYWIVGVALALVAGITTLIKYMDNPSVDPIAPMEVVDSVEVGAVDTLVTTVDSVVAE